MKKLLFIAIVAILCQSCCLNSSKGERIGLVTQFSQSGVIWKSWEGHLNMTQTGMNSSTPFDFSIDNDSELPEVVNLIDSAAEYGWKVKLNYREVFGSNWFCNRGETSHFITSVEVLDKNPIGTALGGDSASHNSGHAVDTIYVVIDNTR